MEGFGYARVAEAESGSDPHPGGTEDSAHVLVREDLVEPRLLDVQDRAADRQDRLEAPVAPLLCAVVDEHTARESKVVRAQHLEIVDVHPLGQPLDLDDAMVEIGD